MDCARISSSEESGVRHSAKKNNEYAIVRFDGFPKSYEKGFIFSTFVQIASTDGTVSDTALRKFINIPPIPVLLSVL